MIVIQFIAFILFFVATAMVFGKWFCDGIITKHFLVFSAIASALAAIEPTSTAAFLSGVLLFVAGIGYWAWKHKKDLMRGVTFHI